MYVFADLCSHHCNLTLGHFHHPLAVIHQIRTLYTFGPVFEDFGFREVSLSSYPHETTAVSELVFFLMSPFLASSYTPAVFGYPAHAFCTVLHPIKRIKRLTLQYENLQCSQFQCHFLDNIHP